MCKPALSLQTVYCHQSDRDEAQRLGNDLYQHLTRPVDDPLGYGASIPVRVGVSVDNVDLEAASVVVLLPVLGKTSFNMDPDGVVRHINGWHEKLGPGHVIPVPTSKNWLNADALLRGKQLRTELYSREDPRRRTLDEIVLAVSRLLDPSPDGVRLFVSHAKADLEATEHAAKRIHDFVTSDSTGKAFFDATDLRPGESLSEQLENAVRRGVLIVVRGDTYSSRVWCQRELLQAKLNGIPTITLEILRKGDQRSSPYAGNAPCFVWQGQPEPIVSRAMVEWLRSAFFCREAERIIKAAGLPDDVPVVARPPELLDLAQGPLRSELTRLVLHPDPELSVVERQVLKAARPRLQLVTPTTAFRRLLTRGSGAEEVSSPLEGMQVAMSLSDSPAEDGPEGFTRNHTIDATVYVARTLISAGAAIAYGGDFRTNGYTPLLAQLIQTYNQTATKLAQRLHSYLAAIIQPEEAPDNLPLAIHHLVRSAELAQEAILPPPSTGQQHPPALYVSDMRRLMAKHTAARVVLGGNSVPRTEKMEFGYRGRYPGVVEEAWRTLEDEKPLYVLGGFGGAAALVADLLEDKEVPPQLKDETWMTSELFRKTALAIDKDPFHEKLGLPLRMEDLAEKLRARAKPYLASDEASQRWNGLSREENRLLFRSRDPVTLASLVLKGLLSVARARSVGKVKIELIHDTVTAASKLDAIAIATLDRVPLGGAGAVLDQLLGGRASAEHAQGRTLVSLKDATVDADWLFLASLGRLEDAAAGIEERVKEAARATADQVNRHGFERVGVVTFGGNILSDTEAIAHAMIGGFAKLPDHATVVWFETDQNRFNRLEKVLEGYTKPSPERPPEGQRLVKLTTRRAVAAITPLPSPQEPLIVEVRLEKGGMVVTTLPPSASAVVAMHRAVLSEAELLQLSEGSGSEKRNTPGLEILRQRGAALAKSLFGDQAGDILGRCRGSKVVLIHDVPASKIPFEMLATETSDPPAIEGGISRRLAVPTVPVESQFARPPKKDKLQVLLIVNPTEDLPGAVLEAEAVETILAQQTDRVSLQVLTGKEATREAVSEALAKADVLHYCGHAFFDGPRDNESGLILAKNTPFMAADLARVKPLPRMAFVNACEAGRVRGQVETEAAAFAELFLRSGVEAYVGTYWRVQDSAAARFAAEVYTQLALGESLEVAVTKARKVLLDAREPDWANYMLFGGGGFRLVVGSA